MPEASLSLLENGVFPAVGTLSRIAVILNPVAGGLRRRRLDAALAVWRDAGVTVTLHPTGAPGDGSRIARQIAEADRGGPGGLDAVIAAGGDGTAAEIANGLRAAGSGLPLALLPLGTANVLAHEIGLSGDPVRAARQLLTARPALIHPGICDGRLFLQMCGIGFDARVVAGLRVALKHRLGRVGAGKLAYVWESLVLAARLTETRYRLVIDGTVYEAGSAIITNGRFYGGHFLLAPKARLDATAFQVCLFARGRRIDVLRYGAALMSGRLPGLSDIRMVQGRTVVIDGPVGEPIQADGDLVGHLSTRIERSPDPLTLLVPTGSDLRSGHPE